LSGDRGGLAQGNTIWKEGMKKKEKKKKKEENERKGLTLTGLLMEGLTKLAEPTCRAPLEQGAQRL
jgi:hypothetical protein